MSDVIEREDEPAARSSAGVWDRREPKLDCEFLIVGAGLSGMAAAVYLQKSGFQDILLLDRAHTLGGTWRDNT